MNKERRDLAYIDVQGIRYHVDLAIQRMEEGKLIAAHDEAQGTYEHIEKLNKLLDEEGES